MKEENEDSIASSLRSIANSLDTIVILFIILLFIQGC